mmetsp:Transcript_110185/g.306386  ORF Transcript_110185/g.306386 Transcript_110185/m.306386 type:complete len:324 (+) Transcript_110185:170-1141(+)
MRTRSTVHGLADGLPLLLVLLVDARRQGRLSRGLRGAPDGHGGAQGKEEDGVKRAVGEQAVQPPHIAAEVEQLQNEGEQQANGDEHQDEDRSIQQHCLLVRADGLETMRVTNENVDGPTQQGAAHEDGRNAVNQNVLGLERVGRPEAERGPEFKLGGGVQDQRHGDLPIRRRALLRLSEHLRARKRRAECDAELPDGHDGPRQVEGAQELAAAVPMRVQPPHQASLHHARAGHYQDTLLHIAHRIPPQSDQRGPNQGSDQVQHRQRGVERDLAVVRSGQVAMRIAHFDAPADLEARQVPAIAERQHIGACLVQCRLERALHVR